MKHRVRHADHPGVVARAGTDLAAEMWNDGGWQTCVGRWAVILVIPGTYAPGKQCFIYASIGVERHTSLSKARRSVAHHNKRTLFDQPVQAFLVRWRRDLGGSVLDGEATGVWRHLRQRGLA
jgi:hypothetical protein